MNALSALFVEAREADEFEREDILQEAYRFTSFAVKDTVALRTPKGRIFIDRDHHGRVWFDFYPKDRFVRLRCWFNSNTVSSLRQALKDAEKDKKVPMERIMTEW